MNTSSVVGHVALVREVSRAIDRCELTHVPRTPISFERAAAQHEIYVEVLARLGCAIEWLPALHDAADAVFVEDTAVILPEIAVIMRPGAVSRRIEVDSTESALARYRDVVRIEGPGTMDGGDVLVCGRTIYTGASSRSSPDGLAELRRLTSPFGYEVRSVPLRGCLHLKSAACFADDGLLVFNPSWVDPDRFDADVRLAVDPDEPAAANVLRLRLSPGMGHVLMDSAHPRTAARLRAEGVDIQTVDLSELAKAEGAVTCCSILVKTDMHPVGT